MSALFPWFLFVHVLGAVIAFGPTFSMSIIGGAGGKEPMHANFATRVSEAIAKRRILPLAYLQGIIGVGLILTGNINPFEHAWLLVGIILWAVALGYALTIQGPAVHQVIEMTSGGPPPPPADGAAPAGPPPALRAAVRRVQRGGMILGALVIVIVFLMVVKPAI